MLPTNRWVRHFSKLEVELKFVLNGNNDSAIIRSEFSVESLIICKGKSDGLFT